MPGGRNVGVLFEDKFAIVAVGVMLFLLAVLL